VAGHAHKGLPRGEPGYSGRAMLRQSFSAVTGACLVIRKELFQQAGGLNAENLIIAFNDVDFCLRLNDLGFRNVWTPFAELYHHESATRGYEDTPEKHSRFLQEMKYMQERWGDRLLNDPAYSPNLTLERQDFDLAWPPRLPSAPEVGNQEATDTEAAAPSSLSRVEKALHSVDLSGLGLEIGPSHNPIVPKSKGFRVHVLDHATAAELREKYRGHGVDLEQIEEVDFVWRGEPLPVLIGREGCYDYIIASHVIEHSPDLLGFLSQCEKLLKSGGVLSLVIPDKRFCFDYFSAPSSTGEVLDAHLQERKRPSPGKIWDHFANAAKRNGRIAWTPADSGDLEFVHTEGEASLLWRSAISSPEYPDIHNWRFTPTSFRLLIHDLQALGFISLREKCFFTTKECDFFITLSRDEKVAIPRMSRMALLLAIGTELITTPLLEN
jgi:predicted SAM-dependent methyltransferase